MTRREIWLAVLVAAAIAALVAYLLLRPKPPRLTLAAAQYSQFIGWREDVVAIALPALRRSCKAFLAKPDDKPLDVRPKEADFGTVGEWRVACTAAEAVAAGDDNAARRFFEAEFTPLLAGNNGEPDGLFTGYFEMTLRGARQRGGPYQIPLYRRPPEAQRTGSTRAEIEDGALVGKVLELVWVDDPIDAFFLEIQGSGRVELQGGGVMRVGYDGSNGKAYVPVGRLLIERGELPKENVTMASIRGWMKAHPKEGAALRRDNPSYVFFREISGEGPLGAERIALTAGRSLAVDRAFLPLGVPLWVEAQERFRAGTIRRLVIAQDTGGAIKGPVRGDLFWGHGPAAAESAGGMNAKGRYYLLLPKAVAARLTPKG